MGKYNFDISRFVSRRDIEKANDLLDSASEKEIIEMAQAGNKGAINCIFLNSGKFVMAAFKTYTGPVKEYFKRAVQNGDYEMFVSECYAMLKDPESSPLSTFDCSKYGSHNKGFFNHFGFYFLQYAKGLARQLKSKEDRMGVTGNVSKDTKFSKVSLDYTNSNKDDSDHAGNNKFEDYLLDADANAKGKASSLEDEVLEKVYSEDDDFMVAFKGCLHDKAWEKKDGALKKIVRTFIEHPDLDIYKAVKISGLVSEEELAEKKAQGMSEYEICHKKASTFKRYLQEILPEVFENYGVDLNQFLSRIQNGNTSAMIKALGGTPKVYESRKIIHKNSIFGLL